MRLIDADALPKTKIVERKKIFVDGKQRTINLHEEVVQYANVKRAPTIAPESLFPYLVDKIASYLEQEENWGMLKHDCWLIDGKSDELRALLYKAISCNSSELSNCWKE